MDICFIFCLSCALALPLMFHEMVTPREILSGNENYFWLPAIKTKGESQRMRKEGREGD